MSARRWNAVDDLEKRETGRDARRHNMTVKALATIPTAFLTGIAARSVFTFLERFDPSPSTAGLLFAYVVVSIAPFLVFVPRLRP